MRTDRSKERVGLAGPENVWVLVLIVSSGRAFSTSRFLSVFTILLDVRKLREKRLGSFLV